MKRTLTAAAAALACASAFSQTPSDTLYGVMDVGYTHSKGDISSWNGLA